MKKMLIIGAAVVAVALAVLHGPGMRAAATEYSTGTNATTEAEALAESRKAAASLLKDTKSTFKAFAVTGDMALAARGCSGEAHKIAAYYMDSTGNYIRRVSLKNRSAGNVPDDYERAILEKFDKLNEAGLVTDGFEDYRVVTTDGKKTMRYMAPIKTKKGCLKCHGVVSEIPAPVKEFLAERYPGDLATGYKVGDIRGAVSVKVEIK